MDEETYLQKRLDDQLDWYDRKSQSNQKRYRYLRVIEIVAAACIPFLAAYMTEISSMRVVVGVLGVLVAVIVGVVSLYRFQELWAEYRTTAESLKHEKYLFATKTAPYNTEHPFPLLVERVEDLISKEHTRWTRYMKRAGSDENKR